MFVKVSSSELNLFFQRLSAMIEAGVTLHEAILFLEQGETNPKLRLALEGVYTRITRGNSLSRSLADFPHIFPRLAREIIAVGENTGMLVSAFRRIAIISQRALERRQMIWSALAYPICLSVVMLGVIVMFVVYVAPGEDGLFASLGDEMPWPSEVLITVSNFLSNPTYVTVGLIIVVLFALAIRRFVFTNQETMLKLHKLCLILPVIGPLVAKSEIAKTLDVVASSTSVGAPLMVSLRSCRSVAGNLEYRQKLIELSESIKHGEAFGSGFASMPYTPRYVGAMLEVTDETGSLDTVSRNLADAVEEDLRTQLDSAVKLLEPCLLLISGLAAGFVTVATFLPVVRLITAF
jgi:type IV pilus assembly protein PilC